MKCHLPKLFLGNWFMGRMAVASLVTLDVMFGLWELSFSTFLVLLTFYIYTFLIYIKSFTARWVL